MVAWAEMAAKEAMVVSLACLEKVGAYLAVPGSPEMALAVSGWLETLVVPG